MRSDRDQMSSSLLDEQICQQLEALLLSGLIEFSFDIQMA